MRALILLFLACLLGVSAWAETGAVQPGAGGSAAKAPVKLVIETPAPGGRVESKMHMAEVRGTAIAGGDGPRGYDVMLVVDVSKSTRNASGADVDGDNEIGEDPTLGLYAPGEFDEDVRSTDPEDTILHAEAKAALTLLDGLDPRRVRVGLVTFSGAVDPKTGLRRAPEQQDATLQVPLTDDYDRIRGALATMLAKGPHGATNFSAGIRLATRELAGMSSARSQPRPDFKKVVLFLTDGFPSFPAGRADVSDPEDLEAAVRSAKVAQTAGIRINSFALGTNALTRPKAATEIARVTLGTFTPVVEPGSIVAALHSVSFANVEDVGIINVTTREEAPDVQLNPDGSFIAFVPVQEGRNRIIVNAVASDGSQANRELVFEFGLKESGDLAKQRELDRLRKMTDELKRYRLAQEMERARERSRRMKQILEIEVDRSAR
ncbi:MAG: hypothetical protein CL910_10555 [Deltaproteobacteria bacterium]|jgi:hypothetical protein|nr:hypothetical protein [Deltaproteobacteria bacterium]